MHVVNSNQVKSTTGEREKASHSYWGGEGCLLQEMAKKRRSWHQAEFAMPGKFVKMSADILCWQLWRNTEPENSNSFLWWPIRCSEAPTFPLAGTTYLWINQYNKVVSD